MNKNDKKPILWRFIINLGIIALLLMLTAFSCNSEIELTISDDEDDDDEVSCAVTGFSIKFAKEGYKNAFAFGSFKKDEETGSFDAALSVKLSELTKKNGFVSNHVWIHPDKTKSSWPFRDRGTLTPTTQGADVSFAAGNFDGRFCSYGLVEENLAVYGDQVAQGKASTLEAGLVSKKFTISETATPGKPFLTGYENDPLEDNAFRQCSDAVYFGDIVSPTGGLRVGIYGPLGLTGGKAGEPYVNEQYEKNIDKEGAYYVRDNAAYKYVKAKTNPDFFTANGNSNEFWEPASNIVQENDTDAFYDEVKTFFIGGGIHMATLTDVFSTAVNKGIVERYTKQPKGDGEDGTLALGAKGTTKTSSSGDLGANGNGGWQKVFTIKSCDETMKNGFAVAFGKFDDKAAASEWKKEPSLTYTAAVGTEALPYSATEDQDNYVNNQLVIRPGTHTENNHALLLESLVSPRYNGDGGLGLFALQHDEDVGTMRHEKNAFTTKGALVCRSALGLNDGAATAVPAFTNRTTDKATLSAYTNAVIGYVDAEISDENKGLGLTCYLGLSALWPEAIDGAPKAKIAYNKQFDSVTKKEEGKYDVSDKHLGLLLMNVPEGTSINDPLLQPIFADRLASDAETTTNGAKFKLNAVGGKAALKAIKEAADAKIKYVHGVVTVSFVKP